MKMIVLTQRQWNAILLHYRTEVKIQKDSYGRPGDANNWRQELKQMDFAGFKIWEAFEKVITEAKKEPMTHVFAYIMKLWDEITIAPQKLSKMPKATKRKWVESLCALGMHPHDLHAIAESLEGLNSEEVDAMLKKRRR